MQRQIDLQDLLWKNISVLPYFRGFLRAIEGRFFQGLSIEGEILDLGCGDGHFSATTFPHNIIKGIDPSFKSLGLAKNHNFYSGLVCSKGDRLPFAKASFKTVISNSVLEHIPDVDSVINEAVRVLEDSGRLVITVPNSNFTQNLSLACFFDRLRLTGLASGYRKFFNWISRHYHPDPSNMWVDRLIDKKLSIVKTWNYFPSNYLRILEWGHYFGLPFWVNNQLFGRWILVQSKSNWLLRKIYFWLYPYFSTMAQGSEGAYTFIIAEKH